jgi:hypothetical protein
LESLALGYYTLAHDSSIDWILGIKNLKELILDNAMIASYIGIDSENVDEWGPSTKDSVPIRSNDWNDFLQWTYSGRWSTFLDLIASELPNLHEFGFDYGASYPLRDERRYGLNCRHSCVMRVFPQRYVVFDDGILPTHWPEADENGDLKGEAMEDENWPMNLHQDCWEDKKSLNELLEVFKARRRKPTISDAAIGE